MPIEPERKAFPIFPPDPVAAIEARMEQLGWKRKDLERLIGSRARVSEVLNRKRSLTLPMIRKLHAEMSIPAEVLLAEPAKPSDCPRDELLRRVGIPKRGDDSGYDRNRRDDCAIERGSGLDELFEIELRRVGVSQEVTEAHDRRPVGRHRVGHDRGPEFRDLQRCVFE